jgi:hypothetical protein
MNLRIHQLAVAEIDREVDYYESRQSGLGTELEDEIDAVARVPGELEANERNAPVSVASVD